MNTSPRSRRSGSRARQLAMVLPAAALAVSITACSTPAPAATSSSAGASTTITFGALKGVSPVFVGIDKGYFKDQGLNVEVEFVKSGSDLMPLVASDKLDVGVSSPAAGLFNAFNRGVETKIVADSGQYTPGHAFGGLVARKELVDQGTVTKVSDLKGRKIGITAAGSAMQLLALKALDGAGLSSQDAELVTMDFPTMVTSLASGDIDAAMLSEPFLTQAQTKNVGTLLEGADQINPGGQQIVLVYSPGMMKDKDLGKRFMTAWLKSVRDYSDGYQKGGDARVAVDASQAKHLGVDPAVLAKSVPYGLDPNGALNMADLQDRLDSWVKLGLVKKAPLLNDIVDQSFREGAVAALGS